MGSLCVCASIQLTYNRLVYIHTHTATNLAFNFVPYIIYACHAYASHVLVCVLYSGGLRIVWSLSVPCVEVVVYDVPICISISQGH